MTYFFDGTENGFLTAFLQAFSDENALLSSMQTQLVLGQEPIFVQTDESKAEKVRKRLLSFDGRCIYDLQTLLRAGESDREQAAFLYLRVLAKAGKPVKKRLAIPEVYDAVERIRRVGFEIHRMHGFIRFMETASGVLYAPFSPDNDICDLLVPHFRARFPHIPFVLHDVKRKKAACFDGRTAILTNLPSADVLLSDTETQWQALWKEYYHSVNIPERERLKQMRGYMPVRYWKFMPEKQENELKN